MEPNYGGDGEFKECMDIVYTAIEAYANTGEEELITFAEKWINEILIMRRYGVI